MTTGKLSRYRGFIRLYLTRGYGWDKDFAREWTNRNTDFIKKALDEGKRERDVAFEINAMVKYCWHEVITWKGPEGNRKRSCDNCGYEPDA